MAIRKYVPLSLFTTFEIGGPAKYLIEVKSEADALEALKFAKLEKLPFIVLGKGSNALFDDEGFDGLVLINKLSSIAWTEPFVKVGSGYSFSLLGVQSARRGLSGLEFASGIPASVGGAVFMNAGASGSETFESLEQVEFLTSDLETLIFPKEKLQYGYRFSSFQKMRGMILSATFKLSPNEDARKKQLEIVSYRTKTQPYSEKSAGCMFRNSPAKSAGALIDECGLKGLKCGDAEVSSLHANFIINKGRATAQDILKLVQLVQKTVLEKTGIMLEMEVRMIPFKENNGI